jgi:hypothetical protein
MIACLFRVGVDYYATVNKGQSHRAYHPIERLDIFLGNKVANDRCEAEPDPGSGAYRFYCGCPDLHYTTILVDEDLTEDYATRKIEEIGRDFTCC